MQLKRAVIQTANYTIAVFLVVAFYYVIFFQSLLMVEAVAVSWTGSGGDGKWETPGNWNTGLVPTSTDQVTISGATVTLSAGQIASFNTLTIGSSTAEFILAGNIANGGSITVATSGTFTQQNNVQQSISGTFTVQNTGLARHTANTSTQLYGLRVNANAIDIQSGGKVSADGAGFMYNSSGNGYGPGGGGGNTFGGGGGAHGGNGAFGGSPAVITKPGGVAYCDVTNLTTMGSGGGGVTGGLNGGSGGGYINLAASTTITINGWISATGTAATGTWYGGGAGGGIRLTAATVAGTPTVFSVAGGAGANGGGGGAGGGGCVQISYTTSNSISPTAAYFSMSGGVGGVNNGGAGITFIKNTGNGTSGDLYSSNSATTVVSSTIGYNWIVDSLTANTSSILIVSSTKILTFNSSTPFRGDNTAKIAPIGTITATTATLFAGVGLDFFTSSGTFNNPTSFTVSSTAYFGPSTFTNPITALTIAGPTTTLYSFTSTTPLRVDTLTISNGGRLTHFGNVNAITHVLSIRATTTITVNAGGAITADGTGYTGGNGPGAGATNGLSGGGGAHAGNGSLGLSANTVGGFGYCNPSSVASMGSGGGGNSVPGNGGGLIYLSASSSITVNGTLSANGNIMGSSGWQSGGGGGGIILNAPTIAGTPTAVTAKGSAGGTGSGSGGGGCIQVLYSISNTITPSSSFVSVAGGAGALSTGGAGFMYIKNTGGGGNGDLYLNNAISGGASTTLAASFTVDTITMNTSSLLIVTSTKTLTLASSQPFGGDGTGRILFNGSLSLANTTTISNITLDFSGGGTFINSSTLTAQSGLVFGPNTLTNPLTTFIISGGTTTLFSFTTTTALNVNTLSILNGGHLTHQTNTSTQLNVLNIHATSTITINSGGFINIDSAGYAGGPVLSNGYGPGGGIGTSTLHGAGGAGHGGAGGAGSSAAGGAAYCNIANVATLGSGGGSGISTIAGAAGGGLVILNAGSTITMNGTITARGQATTNVWNGGGAGGGVKITADTIVGTPFIDVSGGVGNAGGGGGGGGGCIQLTFTTANSVNISMVSTTGGIGNVNGGNGLFAANQLAHNAAPINAVTTTIATSSIGIAWTWGGGTETRYGVERSTDGISYTQFSLVTPTSTVATTVTGLTPNTRYWFRVASGDGTNATSSYATTSPAYTAASTPSNLLAQVNSTSQITLTWTGDATQYFVTNTTSGLTSGWISQTTTSFSGLTCSTTYSFSVKGRNGDSLETAAATVNATTSACPTSAPPTSPVTSAVTTSSITLSWSWGGGSETRYAAERSTDNILFTQFALVTPTSTLSATASGLLGNTRYWLRVASGDASIATSSYATASPIYTLANTPSNFVATVNSASQITLTWTGNATQYFATNTTAGTTSGWIAQTTTVFSGLTCSTTYSFSVKGRNGDLVETVAATTSATTSACPPSAAPSGVTASALSTSSISISWSWGGGSETRYAVEKSTDGVSYSQFALITPTSTLSATATGLSVNTRYWFRVASGDGTFATSSYATSSPAYTLASTPANVAAQADSATQITLTWIGDATQYFVTNTTAGTTAGWLSQTTTSFSGLTCATLYNFSVKGRNGDAVETAAAAVSATTNACPANNNSNNNSSPSDSGGGNTTPVNPSLPPWVGAVTVDPSTTSARVGWSVVDDKAIIKVTFEYGPTPALGLVAPVSNNSAATVMGLSPGVQYYYSITAVDSYNNTTVQTGVFSLAGFHVHTTTTLPVVAAPQQAQTRTSTTGAVTRPVPQPVTTPAVHTTRSTTSPLVTRSPVSVPVSGGAELTGSSISSTPVGAGGYGMGTTTPYQDDVFTFFLDPRNRRAWAHTVVPIVVAITFTTTAAFISWFDLLALLRYLFLQPSLLLGTKRRKGWGQVYNALNKLPLDLVTVRLVDATRHVVVQTHVTDKNGRYAFLAAPGKYYLFVVKPGYEFPSRILGNFTEDGTHTDIYRGGEIVVNEENVVVTHNIPLDPIEGKAKPKRISWFVVGRTAQITFSFAGLAIVMGSLWASPDPYMFALAAVHIALILIFERLALPPKIKSWGSVYDVKTKSPLGRSVARLYNAEFNKLVETQITDRKGRYYFMASDSQYFVSYEHSAYVPVRSKVIDMRAKEATTITYDVGLTPEVDNSLKIR